MATSVSTLVTSRPKLVVVAFAIVTALMIPGVLQLQVQVDVVDYFPNSPIIEADDAIRELFPPTNQSVVVVVSATDGKVDARELRALVTFEESVWADAGVRRFVTLPQGEAIQSLLEPVRQTLAANNQTIAAVDDPTLDATLELVLTDPRLAVLMADDRSSTLLVVQTKVTDGEADQVAVRKVARAFHGGTIDPVVAGAFIEEMNESSVESLRILLPVSIALIIVILVLSLRRILDAMLVFLMIPIVLIWLAGSITYLHLTFSQLTFFAPMLLLAIGVDDGLHLLHRYREEGARGSEPTAAMRRSISMVGMAVFLTTLTTSAAFASNLVSTITAIRDFGLALALGMGYALLGMVVLLPALRLILPHGRQTALGSKDTAAKLRRPPSRVVLATVGLASRGPLVVLAVVALTLPALWAGSGLQSSLRNGDLVADDADVIVAFDALDSHYHSIGVNNALVLVRGPIATLPVLRAIDDVSLRVADDQHIARIGGQVQLLSLSVLVRTAMADPMFLSALNLSDGNGDGLPDEDASVALVCAALLQMPATAKVTASVLHRDNGGRFDATVLRFTNVDVKGTIEQKEVLDEVNDDIQPLRRIAGLEVIATGAPVIFYTLLTDISDSMVQSVIVSIIVVSLLLVAVFRSLRLGLIGVLPVVLVAIWILATMRLLGLSLNVVTVTVTAMTVGVGVDHAIHIIQRYREELDHGTDHKTAVTLSLQYSGAASVGAAASTGLGFLVLAFSPMNMFATFGILSTLMLVYSLIATVVLVPALLLMTADPPSRRPSGPRLSSTARGLRREPRTEQPPSNAPRAATADADE